MSHELFIKHCTELIEKRGHHFIRTSVEKKARDGTSEYFDIVFGWPLRSYCICNFSDNPVKSEDILAFEVGIPSFYSLEIVKTMWCSTY